MRHCGQNKWRGTRQKRIRVGGKLAEHLQIPTSECLTDECPGRRWCVGEGGNFKHLLCSVGPSLYSLYRLLLCLLSFLFVQADKSLKLQQKGVHVL